MSKKDFKTGLNTLIGDTSTPEPTTPTSDPKEERATFILPVNLHDELKAIAYWERLKLKEVVKEALTAYIERYKAEKGDLLPIPERGK
jgi:hypothetical protein